MNLDNCSKNFSLSEKLLSVSPFPFVLPPGDAEKMKKYELLINKKLNCINITGI